MIICDTNIHIFNLTTFQNIDSIETFENSKGIFAYTQDLKIDLIAFPYKAIGYVKLKSYTNNETILINAHQSNLIYIALSNEGKYLATASERGTVIRLFNTNTGEYIHEFRRGEDSCEIYYLTFDMNTKYLALTCSTSTVHIFCLNELNEKYFYKNQKE